MRDAVNLQPFRTNSQALEMEAIIEASILQEFQQQKAAAATLAASAPESANAPTATAGSTRGRGRGWGRGRGQGRGRGAAAGEAATLAMLPATQRLAQLQNPEI